MKHLLKKITAAILFLCLTLSFTACTAIPSIIKYDDNASNQEETKYPMVVLDQGEREVTLENKPERIVSGYYISSSTLMALGLKDQVVGIEGKANTRNNYALAAPEFLELPNVGTAKDFNMESCLALKPDLVILPLKLKDVANTLTQMGVPTICINPENQELLIDSIELIAKATDTVDSSEILIDYIIEAKLDLANQIGENEPKKVYLTSNSSLLSTASKGMYQMGLLKESGAESLSEDLEGATWANISYEQLLAYNPEYIMIAPAANFTAKDVMEDKNLASIEAVILGNVFEMPGDIEAWDSPIPSSFLGSYWLASVLWPEIVSKEDYSERINEFYNLFYGFSVEEQ